MLDLSRLADIPPWLFPLGVLALSLTGSLHCAAMCGPLCLGLGGSSRASMKFYHLGRLVSYLLLGLLAGFLGKVLLAEIRAPLVFALAVGLGLIYLVTGGHLLLGNRVKGSFPFSLMSRALKSAQKLQPDLRAGVAGLMSGALPCGWLYSFVLASAASQSLFWGATILFFFWLGTVPALSGVQFLARRWNRSHIEGGLRWTFGVVFIVYGVFILHHRLSPLWRGDAASASGPVCIVPASHIE